MNHLSQHMEKGLTPPRPLVWLPFLPHLLPLSLSLLSLLPLIVEDSRIITWSDSSVGLKKSSLESGAASSFLSWSRLWKHRAGDSRPGTDFSEACMGMRGTCSLFARAR